MAINDNNGTKNQQPSAMAAAFAEPRQQQNANQGSGKPAAGFSFRNMGMVRTAMGRTPASEVLSKLLKAITTICDEGADKSYEITLVPVDMNNTTNLSVSALAVCVRDLQNPEIGVAYHTLVLEASAEPLPPRFEVINGSNIEILRPIGDAYDVVMLNAVSEFVGRKFPQVHQLPVGACVVPRDLKSDDVEAVYSLTSNALFACTSELAINSPNFTDLNLNQAERDLTLTVCPTFGNQQTLNAVGQPVRSDIVVEFSAAPTQNNNQQQNNAERVTKVAKATGFVDLVYDPAAPVQNNYWLPQQQQQQQNVQRYSARFVLTAMEATHLLTIPAQLLALIPALSIREGSQWIQAFRHHSFSNEIDMHDIGAIGYEMNLNGDPSGFGTRIDTKADSFKPDQLGQLIGLGFKQGLILSLDVPEVGPETWYNEVFSAAASGNAKANQAIIDAANVLTNGNFSKYFAANGRVAMDEYNRIHLGHYGDRNGVRKDIRDIDYLAIMNLQGEKDPQIIKDWSDTFLRTNYPLTQRLAARKRIITALFSDVVFTGFARRVTFDPLFIEALSKGCQDAGLMIRTVTQYNDVGGYERATGGMASAALMSSDPVGLFSRGGYGQNNQMYGAHNIVNPRYM